jgi:hypothetical protein
MNISGTMAIPSTVKVSDIIPSNSAVCGICSVTLSTGGSLYAS